MVVEENLLHDPLAQHTELIDTGIRVREQITLGRAADLIKHRPVPVQKLEVGSLPATSVKN